MRARLNQIRRKTKVGAMFTSRLSAFVLNLFIPMLVWAANASAQVAVTDPTLGPPRYSPHSSLSEAAEPESGAVTDGSFVNEYFQLALPLLTGWQEDMKGPVPSNSGYYVLEALRTKGELKGTVFIDAQDMFFQSPPIHDAMEFSQRREHQASVLFQDVIDHAPREVQLAGGSFARLDYSGAGYHHALFSMIVRCHVVTIDISSRFPEVFQALEENMGRVSLLKSADPAVGGGSVPVCLKDYVSDTMVTHRVEPVMVGPRFTRVPVRFVVDEKGKIKHIHVINALPVQAQSVKDALAQWTFKPYLQNGHAVEVETGMVFEFPPRDGQQNTARSSN